MLSIDITWLKKWSKQLKFMTFFRPLASYDIILPKFLGSFNKENDHC